MNGRAEENFIEDTKRKAEMKMAYNTGYMDGYRKAMIECLGVEEYNKKLNELNEFKDEWFSRMNADPDGDGIGE